MTTEEGISDAFLYDWLAQCLKLGKPVPGRCKTGDEWSGKSKSAVVIETAALSEVEFINYCRKKGLYVEQKKRWRDACI